MKKVLALLFVAILLLLPLGCATDSQPTPPPVQSHSSTSATTETTTVATTTTTTITTTTQKAFTKAQAEKIAKEKVDDYFTAAVFGVCCEMEYAVGDMSRFLTGTQLKNYHLNQWKITCCSTPAEVKAHLYRAIDSALLNRNVDELLFFDDQQNLYVMVPAHGIDPHDDITVTDYSATHITATANQYYVGVPRELAARYRFTLQNRDGNFVITNVTYTSAG